MVVKLDFPGNLWLAAFAILAMFSIFTWDLATETIARLMAWAVNVIMIFCMVVQLDMTSVLQISLL